MGAIAQLYDRYILPRVVNAVCGQGPMQRQRAKVVPEASGVVLEIGIGSGLNLPFYTAAKVQAVLGLDPSSEMWDLARERAEACNLPLEFMQTGAEKIPLEDRSIDSIVMTYALCTIPDTTAALNEMRRVLKPGGTLLFTEHGLAPEPGVQRWQNRLNPLWSRLGGGCNLNRPTETLLREAGFGFQQLEQGYIPGWRPASYTYWGRAVPQ